MSATRSLAEYLAGAKASELPEWTLHEAQRTLINFLAVSIAASDARPVRSLLEWARAEGARPRATAIGAGLRTSPGNAALLNGYMAHLQDFDDTHFPTMLDPTAPVWPAVLALAEDCGAAGRAALAAFVLGAETACRVALSVHPWHYDAGWHVTGTAGVFAAAAGTGWLLGLDAVRMRYALGTAGTQAGGVREVIGSDAKAMHPARAASSGLQAATLAKSGFSSADDIFGGRRGFWAVLSPAGHSEEALLGELGARWELRNNGLKPYANGVPCHPIQDAVIQLQGAHALAPEEVRAIELRVHPLVLELMDRPEPASGFEGKFSFQHCVAAALVDGRAHIAQFADSCAADPTIRAVRAKVRATVDESFRADEAHLAITLADGRTVETHVAHATGSPENPLSDNALEAKFRMLTNDVLGPERAEALLGAVWDLDGQPSVGEVARLMVKPAAA